MKEDSLNIAMLSIHSNPNGQLGTIDTGGMSVYISELARELGVRGHRVDIFTRLPEVNNRSVIEHSRNVRMVHLAPASHDNLSRMALYPYLNRFFQSLETFRREENLSYDVIHSHYWLSGRLGTWAQNEWNRPHVVTFHTLGESKNKTGINNREPELRIAGEKKLVQNCHRIVVSTGRERDNLVRFYGASIDKIGVVPCGVNLALFKPENRLQARQRLGFDPDETILLYVGRFDPLKGLDILLESMACLKNVDRLRLVVVGGDGKNTAAHRFFEQKTAELAISEKCLFTGPVEQKKLPYYYHAADLLIIPSRYESFGLVGLEALACGRPVISTPVGAMADQLSDTRGVRVIPSISPQSLADEIRTHLTRSSLLSPVAIRESIIEYSWSRVADAIIGEYRVAIDQHAVDSGCSISAQATG